MTDPFLSAFAYLSCSEHLLKSAPDGFKGPAFGVEYTKALGVFGERFLTTVRVLVD